MRRTQPSPLTFLVIRFLTILMRKNAEPMRGFGKSSSESELLQDEEDHPRNEWQETVAVCRDISVTCASVVGHTTRSAERARCNC